jgi:hypothetical protein
MFFTFLAPFSVDLYLYNNNIYFYLTKYIIANMAASRMNESLIPFIDLSGHFEHLNEPVLE